MKGSLSSDDGDNISNDDSDYRSQNSEDTAVDLGVQLQTLLPTTSTVAADAQTLDENFSGTIAMLFDVEGILTWFVGRIRKWYPPEKRGINNYNDEVEYSDGVVDQRLMVSSWLHPDWLEREEMSAKFQAGAWVVIHI